MEIISINTYLSIFFVIIIVGVNPREMTAVVTSPSGRTEQCMISEMEPSNYSIKFVPQEMGVHTVSVRHRNQHIPGKSYLLTID